jgi:hypothetical protein
MSTKENVRIASYTAKKPTKYKDHGDRVLAYVPPSNPWAKKDPKKS